MTLLEMTKLNTVNSISLIITDEDEIEIYKAMKYLESLGFMNGNLLNHLTPIEPTYICIWPTIKLFMSSGGNSDSQIKYSLSDLEIE